MRIPRIYIDTDLSAGQTLQLPQKQSHYLCKSLRLKTGRSLWLFNGQGGAFKAEITSADVKSAQLKVADFEQEDRQSPLKTELAIALSKGDRFEVVLQKATELGVSYIKPLITERSEVRLNTERLQKKHEHWQGIVVSACEQCGRNLLPVILDTQPLNDYLAAESEMPGIVLDPKSDQAFSALESTEKGFRILIGPEGGLSDQELAAAQDTGFMALNMGPRVLRTETAPLVALSILQSQFGDI